MSFHCNLILIVTMENIYHLMLIGMSAIFTHFIGDILSVSAVYIDDCTVFFGIGTSNLSDLFHDFFSSCACSLVFYLLVFILVLHAHTLSSIFSSLEVVFGIYIRLFLTHILNVYYNQQNDRQNKGDKSNKD
jgi:hypothetical protein